jgi:hypothetical protein
MKIFASLKHLSSFLQTLLKQFGIALKMLNMIGYKFADVVLVP